MISVSINRPRFKKFDRLVFEISCTQNLALQLKLYKFKVNIMELHAYVY